MVEEYWAHSDDLQFMRDNIHVLEKVNRLSYKAQEFRAPTQNAVDMSHFGVWFDIYVCILDFDDKIGLELT